MDNKVIKSGTPSFSTKVEVAGESHAKKSKDYVTGDKGSSKNEWTKNVPSKSGNMVHPMKIKDTVSVNGDFCGK